MDNFNRSRACAQIHMISFTASGYRLAPSLSGGDRILIECAKRWASLGYKVYVHTWEGGYALCKRYGLWKDVKPNILPLLKDRRLGIVIFEVSRIIKSVIYAFKFKASSNSKVVVYSASSFWPDSLSALLMKLRNRGRVLWVASYYLFPPRPWVKENPYKGHMVIKGLVFYLMLWPIYWLVRKYADIVWVTNELDRWKFINGKRLTSDKVIAVRGGVDAKTPLIIPEPKEKKFDAVFIGRFHPQKGVLELIDIWKMVCDKKSDAKLAMIGVGNLKSQVREKIRRYNLENNIVLFGFKDGVEKLEIFKNSKIVVHPAIYDSGGMAPCEAMACGLPGVSFDLPALRTYYPKGMLKTPCFNLRGFAENILKLLNDQELYRELQKEALELAKEWDWDKRAEELLKIIMGFLMKNE